MLGTFAMVWSMALIAGCSGDVALRWRKQDPPAPRNGEELSVLTSKRPAS